LKSAALLEGGTVEVLQVGVTDDCMGKVDGVVEAKSKSEWTPKSEGEKILDSGLPVKLLASASLERWSRKLWQDLVDAEAQNGFDVTASTSSYSRMTTTHE
jgi:hypothetical protein